MKLNELAKIAKVRNVSLNDYDVFKQVEFQPDELLQLKEMSHQELVNLMVFCGIRTFNDVPLIVLDDDEMRMAYLVWRSTWSKEKEEILTSHVERGMKWLNYLKQATFLFAQ